MADDKKDTKAKEAGPGNFTLKFALFMAVLTTLVFLPTAILFAVCLVPTLVSFVVDNNTRKTAWMTVGAMNMAGTVPVWFNLWAAGHTVDAALDIIRMPMTIIVSYGGAAVGWFIYVNITPFVANILRMKNEARMQRIEKQQAELVRKWGPDVAKL